MAGSGYREGGLLVWTPSIVTNASNARLLKWRWARFLEDTAESACFAVATGQKYIFTQGSTVLPVGTSCDKCWPKTDSHRRTNPALYTQIAYSKNTEKPTSCSISDADGREYRPLTFAGEKYLMVGNKTLFFHQRDEDDLKGYKITGNMAGHAAEAQEVMFIAGRSSGPQYNNGQQYQERRSFLPEPCDILDVFLAG
ncbi:hypothetical protein MBLNU13_g04509t2 [Cladosporium sp. NU13]